MCRGSPRQSFLAARAIEGRAAGLDDAADSAAAARPQARLVLTVIDGEAMLKDAKLAIGPSMVAQGRPAGLDRLAEDRADVADEGVQTPVVAVLLDERSRFAAGRQAGPREGFADINIAEAGDHRLDEEGLAIVEVSEDIFRPPFEALDLAAFKALRKALGERQPQIGTGKPHSGDAAAEQDLLKPAHHGFDFRKLRHCSLNRKHKAGR